MMFEAFGFMRVFLALQKPISATFGQGNFGYLCLLILNSSNYFLGVIQADQFSTAQRSTLNLCRERRTRGVVDTFPACRDNVREKIDFT